MLKTVPLHAILFGVLPVFCAYSSLVSHLLPDELVIPLALCLVLAVIVLLLSYACLRDWRRAGLVTSVLMLMNFSFDAMAAPANRLLNSLGLPQDDRLYLLPFTLLIGFVVYVLLKSKSDYKLATSSLNVISALLVAGNVGYIAYHEYKVGAILSGIFQNDDKELTAIHLKKTKSLEDSPDIYYFILDAFGRSDTLKEVYDFDNSSFIDGLKQRGFVVPSGSRSNYQMTCLSLPSSLNMQYLDHLEKILGRDYHDSSVLYRILQRNKISSLLKSVGYRCVNVRSGWSPTDYMPGADENVGFPFGNGFHLALLRSTLIGPLQQDFDFLGWAARRVRLYGLQNIGTISSPVQSQAQPQPKFVFVHVVVPHPPFLFNEDGSSDTLNVISLSDKFEKEKYAAQVKFLQRQVLAMLDQLDKSPRKKVVIIQGDHGPALQTGSDGNPSPAFLRERMRILNAYRLPAANPRVTDAGATYAGSTNLGAVYAGATYPATTYATTINADSIYDGITPVNSFRIVLNRYFDAKLPLLPDKCIYSPNPLPMQFVDVTKEVTAGVTANLPTATLPRTATSKVTTATH